jgi:hypothetical protein
LVVTTLVFGVACIDVGVLEGVSTGATVAFGAATTVLGFGAVAVATAITVLGFTAASLLAMVTVPL